MPDELFEKQSQEAGNMGKVVIIGKYEDLRLYAQTLQNKLGVVIRACDLTARRWTLEGGGD